jgi:serine/threonine protein kinase
LVFDKKGYVKICDFKLMRDASQTNYYDSSGTAGYMAPEIVFRQNHGCCADFFSLGTMTYELMMGKVNLKIKFKKLPYDSNSPKEYKEALSGNPVHVKNSDLMEGWQNESADFINKVSNHN